MGVAAAAFGFVRLFGAKGVGVIAVLEVCGAAQRGKFAIEHGNAVMAHDATLGDLIIGHITVQRVREGTDAVVLGAAAVAAFAAEISMEANVYTAQ